MREKVQKLLKNMFVSVVLSCALSIIIFVGMRGMFLIGAPEIQEVGKVVVTYPAISEEEKEFTDKENIERACKLFNFLNYVPFVKADEKEEPLITITYWCKNGVKSVSASGKTVWWNGKPYKLKEEDIFINLTEGLFFLKEAAGQK